jgi:hypothetical protein
MEKQVRVVVFKDGDSWVAQCLEYDIGAQASSLDELHDRLLVTFFAECEESHARNGEPLKGIDAAPQYFHDMWDRKRTDVLGEIPPWQLPCDRTGAIALCA